MAKFCHEMHHVLPMSVIYVAFSALRPSLLHHKSDGFHAFSFETDDVVVIMIIMLEIILISNKRGCSRAVGS
jgi:hypothetical protein